MKKTRKKTSLGGVDSESEQPKSKSENSGKNNWWKWLLGFGLAGGAGYYLWQSSKSEQNVVPLKDKIFLSVSADKQAVFIYLLPFEPLKAMRLQGLISSDAFMLMQVSMEDFGRERLGSKLLKKITREATINNGQHILEMVAEGFFRDTEVRSGLTQSNAPYMNLEFKITDRQNRVIWEKSVEAYVNFKASEQQIYPNP
jgi:hypothetical protein